MTCFLEPLARLLGFAGVAIDNTQAEAWHGVNRQKLRRHLHMLNSAIAIADPIEPHTETKVSFSKARRNFQRLVAIFHREVILLFIHDHAYVKQVPCFSVVFISSHSLFERPCRLCRRVELFEYFGLRYQSECKGIVKVA
jgi:hypothetical protein